MDPLNKIKSMTSDIGIYQHGKFKSEEYNCKSNITEAYGLTIWSLLATGNIKNDKIKRTIEKLIEEASSWTSIRAISSTLLGLASLEQEHSLENELKTKLHNFYFETYSDAWVWFENYLVYANAIIPWSLWEIYLNRKCQTSFEIARKTTGFLIEKCQENDVPAPIGNKGWYYKGRKKALYDEQPIDSAYMVCCLEKAYLATEDKFYLEWAEKWYRWFFGNNINNIPLTDKDFACYDGLN